MVNRLSMIHFGNARRESDGNSRGKRKAITGRSASNQKKLEMKSKEQHEKRLKYQQKKSKQRREKKKVTQQKTNSIINTHDVLQWINDNGNDTQQRSNVNE